MSVLRIGIALCSPRGMRFPCCISIWRKRALSRKKNWQHFARQAAVCEVLSETCPVPVKRLGLTEYSESGDYEEILKKAGLSAACIAEKAEEMIKGN